MTGHTDTVLLIKKCPTESVIKLITGLVEEACGRVGPKYATYSSYWNMEEWWGVRSFLTDLCLNYVRLNRSKDEVLQQLAELPKQTQESIQTALEELRDDIHHALIYKTMQISQLHMNNFDWNLRLAMSSDQMASINKPLVAVTFDVSGAAGSRVVNVELTKDDVHKFITSLEAVNKALQQLRS